MCCNKATLSQKRIEYLDVLRIIATIAVIMIHVAAWAWERVDINSRQWIRVVIYDGIARWAVPIFVMISGVIFGDGKKTDIIVLHKKYIVRIVVAFWFWSLIYSFVSALRYNLEVKEWIITFLRGPVHMWYLYMVVGLYLLVPLLRGITNSVMLTKYFVLLSLIFTFILPYMADIFLLKEVEMTLLIEGALEKINFHFTSGYVSYFIIGFYLNEIDTSGKIKWYIYFGGLIGCFLTIVLTMQLSWLKQMPDETFYNYFSLNVLLESVGVFVFIKNCFIKCNITEFKKKLLRKISKYSFGAYLSHVLVIDFMYSLIKNKGWGACELIGIPIIVILVTIISFGISALLNQIPFIRKYLV